MKMRFVIIVVCLFVFVNVEAESHRRKGDSSVDIFPLREGVTYKYDYYSSYAYYEIMLNHLDVDSGRVEYSVLSSAISDSSTQWNVLEAVNLSVRRYERGRYDSSYVRCDSTFVTLVEELRGLHELRCSSTIWSFPLVSPLQAIYRYSDSSSALVVHSTLPLGGYDSLMFSADSGFTYRNRYAWFGGVTQSSSRTRVHLTGRVTSAFERADKATHFLLYQNYPNPFNPTTNIGFRIADIGFVSLKVFDLLGREVTTLVNEVMMPGNYENEFRSGGLASGVYLYRLQSGGLVQTRKLVVVRQRSMENLIQQ